ncbi:MAG: GntR family transcriptional regulator [Brotaphodocola sp.]
METTLTCDEIYEQLEGEIVQLKTKPGEILSELPLCKRFNISRTPIRSVLQRLQQNGFVQIVPHKGTIVTAIDLDIASQWIYQRLAVESMVLRDFIQSYTPTDIARIHYLHQCLLDSASRLNQPDFDMKNFLNIDLSMHQVWFEATHKMSLWENLTKPHADYSRFIRLDILEGHNVPDVIQEHQELIQIIERKETTSIEPLLHQHLYGGVRRMGNELFSDKYKAYFKQKEKG